MMGGRMSRKGKKKKLRRWARAASALKQYLEENPDRAAMGLVTYNDMAVVAQRAGVPLSDVEYVVSKVSGLKSTTALPEAAPALPSPVALPAVPAAAPALPSPVAQPASVPATAAVPEKTVILPEVPEVQPEPEPAPVPVPYIPPAPRSTGAGLFILIGVAIFAALRFSRK
jgi:hypothetical protein